MCGRFAITEVLSPEALAEMFNVPEVPDFPPRYNIAPTQPILAVMEQHGHRRANLVRWGLVPGWVKDPREFPLVINARVETMGEKPAFRDALKHFRCIVPASGYYEWHTGPDNKKQPYFITLASGEPMAFASVYATWMGPQGEEIDTAALVTTAANADVSHIHHRMPVVLPMSAVDDWLNVREVRAHDAYQLALPLPVGALRAYPVSTRVGSNKVDDPSLIEAVSLTQPEPPAPKPASAQLDLF
ncbi:MAG TPA: SOS response-associated peptidase [Devosiaceae bacterium]|jgi:putative SOS response-associated peptidase YedK